MGLKTIKDIEQQMHVGNEAILSKKAVDDLKYVLSKELRQEAIKWIKSIRRDFPDSDECNSIKELHKSIGSVEWIMHFFRISEGDL